MMKLIYLVAILGFSACSCFSEQGSSLAAWRPSQRNQEWEEEELDLHQGQELWWGSDAPDDYIGRLPGQPSANFKQFAGYVPVDAKSGRALASTGTYPAYCLKWAEGCRGASGYNHPPHPIPAGAPAPGDRAPPPPILPSSGFAAMRPVNSPAPRNRSMLSGSQE